MQGGGGGVVEEISFTASLRAERSNLVNCSVVSCGTGLLRRRFSPPRNDRRG